LVEMAEFISLIGGAWPLAAAPLEDKRTTSRHWNLAETTRSKHVIVSSIAWHEPTGVSLGAPRILRRNPMIRFHALAVIASGAPGGDKDEACANAGLAKIGDRLN
jgi:hypothetical protein